MQPSEDHNELSSLLASLDSSNFKQLVKALPMPTFVKTEDGIHVLCNQSYLDLLNIREEQVIGFRIEDFAPAEIIHNAVANDERLRQGKYSGSISYRTDFVASNGRRRHVDIFKGSLQGVDGRHWIIGIVQEVTEEINYYNELRAQHRFLRTIIDNLPQLIYVKDRQSRFTLANKATALTMTGREDPAPLMGKCDSDFFRPELWVKYYDNEQEVIRSGQALLNSVEPVEGADGGTRWLNTSKLPLRNEHGEIVGIIGIGSDFTQFKKSEEQLRMQATALESAADGIIITDRQGVIIWANSSMKEISGYSVGELIGKTPRLFKSGIHNGDFYKELWRTISSGRTWKGELINRRRDGVLRTEETCITPVVNELGRITHFVSICRDITDRDLLRQEMSRVYAAVARAKDGILLLSREGKPFYVNKAFSNLLGYSMSELPAEALSLLCPEEEHGEHAHVSDITRVRQLDIQARDGKQIPVEVRDWPVLGNGDEQLGRVYFLRDLREERRRAEEQKMMEVRLRQAQKMEAIGQLAAGIAHEINNPIQFIGNNTSFLQSSFSDLLRLIEAQKKALEKAGASADLFEVEAIADEIDLEYISGEVPEAITQTLEGIKRVSDIVKAMKDFSHPGTKNRQRLDINKAVNDSILVARNEWKYHSEIQTDLSHELPGVLCLAGEINQAILNVLVNAAHAISDAVTKGSRERGLIHISTRQQGEEVVIDIRDNGCGIPKAIQDRVFEPFFTTKEVGKGTGQGLAITYDTIVRKHGGRISFSSIPGEGTTFTIALPLNGKTEADK